MDEIKDWRTSMASTLDIMRNLSRIMFEFQADLNALKAGARGIRSAIRGEVRQASRGSRSSPGRRPHKSFFSLLEKTAAKLRNDPFWSD